MKVIEQLITYFRCRGLLTPEQLDSLHKKGFIKLWELYERDMEVDARMDEPVEVTVDDLGEHQDVLENVNARKGKMPSRRKPHSKSRRRWWRDHIGQKKQTHLV